MILSFSEVYLIIIIILLLLNSFDKSLYEMTTLVRSYIDLGQIS